MGSGWLPVTAPTGNGGQRPTAAESALVASRLENSLRSAGINPERISAAVTIADTSGVTVEGAEVLGLGDAVERLREESPEWFAPAVRRTAPDASRQEHGSKDYRNVDRATFAEDLYRDHGIRI